MLMFSKNLLVISVTCFLASDHIICPFSHLSSFITAFLSLSFFCSSLSPNACPFSIQGVLVISFYFSVPPHPLRDLFWLIKVIS